MDPFKELNRRCAGKSIRAAAAELGVSHAYLNDALKERRELGPKILDALGLEKVVTYRRKR